MGHNRLGTLPDTAPWRRVVGAIADGDSAAGVAAVTTDAATAGLDKAKADPGLARAVFLLARTALAAREDDFPAALAAAGVFVPPDPGLFDLTAAVLTATHDWYAATRTRRTDLGEMAALAATEALARCAGDRAGEMFPDGGEARRAARALSTKAGFGRLAHALFARFTARFLMYHLGRELPLHVGGNGRFADPAAHAAFVRDLETHCDQAALIVKDFAAGWFDKSRVEGGVSAERTRGFAAHCVTKLSGELARRGGRRG